MENITQNQWEAYREVQDSGAYNMLSPQAVDMSGLDKDTYFTIIKNYSELAEKYEDSE